MKDATRHTKEIESSMAVRAIDSLTPVMAARPDDMTDEHWQAVVMLGCGVSIRSVALRLKHDKMTIQRLKTKYADMVQDIRVTREKFMTCEHTSNVVIGCVIGSLMGQRLLVSPDAPIQDGLQYARMLESLHRLIVPDPVGEGASAGYKRASRNDLAKASRELGKLAKAVE